jgi:hypothetical protein
MARNKNDDNMKIEPLVDFDLPGMRSYVAKRRQERG